MIESNTASAEHAPYQIPSLDKRYRAFASAETISDLEDAYNFSVRNFTAAESERRWEDALAWLDSELQPDALQTWWPVLALQEKRELICSVWQGTKYPLTLIGQRSWVRMFKDAGFVSDGPPPPARPQELFRGAALARGAHGMSWTPVREIAESFAARIVTRLGQPAALYSAVIPPKAILAYIGFNGHQRGECEAVVNPNMLRGRIFIRNVVTPQ